MDEASDGKFMKILYKAFLIFFYINSLLDYMLFLHMNFDFYLVRPTNCSPSYHYLKINVSYEIGDYWLNSIHGACPTKATVITDDSNGKTLHLHNCISFTDASSWQAIDAANALTGYHSNLKDAASLWYASRLTLLLPILTINLPILFFYGVTFLNLNPAVASFLSFLGLCAGFAMSVASIVNLSSTDMTNAKAWSTTYFASCDVTIVNGTGFNIQILWIVASGFSI